MGYVFLSLVTIQSYTFPGATAYTALKLLILLSIKTGPNCGMALHHQMEK